VTALVWFEGKKISERRVGHLAVHGIIFFFFFFLLRNSWIIYVTGSRDIEREVGREGTAAPFEGWDDLWTAGMAVLTSVPFGVE